MSDRFLAFVGHKECGILDTHLGLFAWWGPNTFAEWSSCKPASERLNAGTTPANRLGWHDPEHNPVNWQKAENERLAKLEPPEPVDPPKVFVDEILPKRFIDCTTPGTFGFHWTDDPCVIDTHTELAVKHLDPVGIAETLNKWTHNAVLFNWRTHDGTIVPWHEADAKLTKTKDIEIVKSEKPIVSDPINQPSHYTHGKVECIDIIRDVLGDSGFIAFCRGNSIKYQYRAGLKMEGDEAQDLAKAAWYSQMAAHVIDPDSYNDPRKLPNTQKK